MNRSLAIMLCVSALGVAAQASAVTFRFQYETPITTSGGASSINATGTDISNIGGATDTATALAYSFPSRPARSRRARAR